MNYIEIVNLIFNILTAVIGLLTLHFAVFFIVGVFKKKKFPKTDKKCKYGIVIAARNEQEVIENFISSVKHNNYPQENLIVFVVAHNCTDETARVAKEAGAVVYEYDNPNERTKGFALKYLFSRINEDFGAKKFDGFFVFDADNILPDDYISKMNDAFVACDGESVITSFRNSKNFGYNIMTAMYGMYFAQGCVFESRGRTALGCSTRVSGTGFLFNSSVVENGWNYVTITEDWEFTADQIIQNNKIVYCDEAVFYDEQPVSVNIMLRQRLRWARGHLLVCTTRFCDLLKALLRTKARGGSEHKFSVYDIFVNTLPTPVAMGIIVILKTVLTALSPLFGIDAAVVWQSYGISLLKDAVIFYASLFITGILLLIMERKRLKHVN